MNIFHKLCNSIFSYGQKELYQYEVACLYGFWEIISDSAKLVFEEQLKHYDRVQRSDNGKHLAFFDSNSDDLCKTWPEKMLFPFRSKPCEIAKISLCIPESKAVVKAEIFIFAGRIAGIEFSQSPKSLQGKELIAIKHLNICQGNNFKSLITKIALSKNPMIDADAQSN